MNLKWAQAALPLKMGPTQAQVGLNPPCLAWVGVGGPTTGLQGTWLLLTSLLTSPVSRFISQVPRFPS